VVATVVAGIATGGVAVTPDGKHVYVANGSNVSVIETTGNTAVIDTASNMVVATVTVGFNPIAVAITPDGKRAYVANSSSPGTVSVIDTASNIVVATVTVGNVAQGVAVTPDGKHVYVANESSGSVSARKGISFRFHPIESSNLEPTSNMA
jgi:YVTN family beta-propeller protein